MSPSCDRCGYLDKLEKHHKKHKADGGSDANPNRRWLCQGCHDYQHALDATKRAIKAEERRLGILRKRLQIIEEENTPDQIRGRGYQAYFEIYSAKLSATTHCGRQTQ